jgi:hypothetical protein
LHLENYDINSFNDYRKRNNNKKVKVLMDLKDNTEANGVLKQLFKILLDHNLDVLKKALKENVTENDILDNFFRKVGILEVVMELEGKKQPKSSVEQTTKRQYKPIKRNGKL